MSGQIQWMSSSLCSSVLRLLSVRRSSSSSGESDCGGATGATLAQSSEALLPSPHAASGLASLATAEEDGTSSFPSSSIRVSACRTLLLLTISTAVLRLRHWNKRRSQRRRRGRASGFLTSGLDSLASVRTRAVALTAWASSCSTSLWVLAASRILAGEGSPRYGGRYIKANGAETSKQNEAARTC